MNLSQAFRKAEAELNPKPPCKGLLFRGYRNAFWSDGRYEEKRGMRLPLILMLRMVNEILRKIR